MSTRSTQVVYLFQFDVPAEIKALIQATPVLITNWGGDKLVWSGNLRGSFDLKSAYSITLDVESTSLVKCGWIWKIVSFPRIKTFLWQCAHDSIGVKGCLVRRGVEEDDKCPVCHLESESVLHAFRDCPRVMAVWI